MRMWPKHDAALHPLPPSQVAIVAYYVPSELSVAYRLPDGAESDVPHTTATHGDALRSKVSWTPTAAQVGTHTIATTWTASGAETRSCDFEVTVAPDACDGHAAAPATDCSGHGRCTMRSPAWPCTCDPTHYGRLCETPYQCNAAVAPITETFDFGFGSLTSAWSRSDSSVRKGRMTLAPRSDTMTARGRTDLSMTVRTVSVKAYVSNTLPSSAKVHGRPRPRPALCAPLLLVRTRNSPGLLRRCGSG